MCQLFALSCNAPSTVTFSFTGFSARGGRTGEHVDGFGLAFHDGAACRLFIDDQRASDSALAGFLRQHPIRARTVVGHIRKATQGPVRWANCHPFLREWQGRHWSFCHNGDLKDFRPRLSGSIQPVGDTDSERAYCWMLQQLRRQVRIRGQPAWPGLAPRIAALARRIGRHGTFNFLLSDGEALYAYAASHLYALSRSHPFPVAHLVDDDVTMDLGMANGPGDRMALVATAPLTRNEDWTPFAPGELRVYVEGVEVWRDDATGSCHADMPAGPALRQSNLAA